MIGDNEVMDSRGVRLLSEISLYDVYRVDTRDLVWHEGHDGEIDGLGSKIGPKPQPGYQMKAHIKGFRLV